MIANRTLKITTSFHIKIIIKKNVSLQATLLYLTLDVYIPVRQKRYDKMVS